MMEGVNIDNDEINIKSNIETLINNFDKYNNIIKLNIINNNYNDENYKIKLKNFINNLNENREIYTFLS